MSYVQPEPGRYRRLRDNAEVTVIGSTGSEWNDSVAVRSPRLSHVRLENFWKKYEPWPARIYFMHDTLTPQNVRAVREDALIIPAVGDTVTDAFGYMGAEVTWTVVSQEWANPEAVTLRMTGPAGEEAACIRCETSRATGPCCSSHNKELCHRCYRLTHFVEVCVCSQCTAEGLPRILTSSAAKP